MFFREQIFPSTQKYFLHNQQNKFFSLAKKQELFGINIFFLKDFYENVFHQFVCVNKKNLKNLFDLKKRNDFDPKKYIFFFFEKLKKMILQKKDFSEILTTNENIIFL